MTYIKLLLNAWRLIFCDLLYLSDTSTHKLILQDASCYKKDVKLQGLLKVNYLLLVVPTFRNIFYYRFNNECKITKMLRGISRLLLPSLETVEIGGNIGGYTCRIVMK